MQTVSKTLISSAFAMAAAAISLASARSSWNICRMSGSRLPLKLNTAIDGFDLGVKLKSGTPGLAQQQVGTAGGRQEGSSVQFQNRTAQTVATNRPARTGNSSARTVSSTETRAKPATAISDDQAISVPPPVQTAPIWPTAQSVATSRPTAGPSAPESEPVSGRPAKPEPSMPVIMPTRSPPKEPRKWL